MDNIVGYICSTPWGTVSRTTPSLGWTPVLPAIPDGWQDAGTGAAPTGFRIIVRPGTRFPTLFPKMPHWGCRKRGKKSRVYHKIFPVKALRRTPTKEIRLNAFSYLLLEEIRRVNRPAGSR